MVCHHVLHNVVDLPPFVRALTAAARRGVVVEMLAEHPMAWLDPLWERFHDLHRPPSATADDAVAVLRELGIDPASAAGSGRPRRARTRRGSPGGCACRRRGRPRWPPRSAELVRPRTAATLTWPSLTSRP